jgi:hypothetical protein
VKTYFILSERLAAVKIVRSRWPNKRLKDLACANPDRLRIIGVLEGDREAEFHQRFEGYRINMAHEWFRLDIGLVEFLKSQFGWQGKVT